MTSTKRTVLAVAGLLLGAFPLAVFGMFFATGFLLRFAFRGWDLDAEMVAWAIGLLVMPLACLALLAPKWLHGLRHAVSVALAIGFASACHMACIASNEGAYVPIALALLLPFYGLSTYSLYRTA